MTKYFFLYIAEAERQKTADRSMCFKLHLGPIQVIELFNMEKYTKVWDFNPH